jgi:hypothetical protein
LRDVREVVSRKESMTTKQSRVASRAVLLLSERIGANGLANFLLELAIVNILLQISSSQLSRPAMPKNEDLCRKGSGNRRQQRLPAATDSTCSRHLAVLTLAFRARTRLAFQLFTLIVALGALAWP